MDSLPERSSVAKRTHAVASFGDDEDHDEGELPRKIPKIDDEEQDEKSIHKIAEPIVGGYIVNEISSKKCIKNHDAFTTPRRVLTFPDAVYVEFVVKSAQILRVERGPIEEGYGGCCNSMVSFKCFDNCTEKDEVPNKNPCEWRKGPQPKYDDSEAKVNAISCSVVASEHSDEVLRHGMVRVVIEDGPVTLDAAIAAVEQVLSKPICSEWTMWIGDQQFEKYTCGKETEEEFYNLDETSTSQVRNRGNLLEFDIAIRSDDIYKENAICKFLGDYSIFPSSITCCEHCAEINDNELIPLSSLPPDILKQMLYVDGTLDPIDLPEPPTKKLRLE